MRANSREPWRRRAKAPTGWHWPVAGLEPGEATGSPTWGGCWERGWGRKKALLTKQKSRKGGRKMGVV